MQSLIALISTIIELYVWCIIIYAVINLLYAFQILNANSQLVYRVYDFLGQLTEPPLRFLRRFIPMIGTVDITPIVLILLLQFVKSLIHEHGLGLIY